MELIRLLDRSEANITQLLQALNPEPEQSLRIQAILTKAKLIFLSFEGAEMQGFVILKPDADKSVVFCPMVLSTKAISIDFNQLVKQVQTLCLEYQAAYCVFNNPFSNPQLATWFDTCNPWDKSVSYNLVQSSPYIATIEPVPGFSFAREEPPYAELLALHTNAYHDEPAYVVGQWDFLLQNYLSNESRLVFTCRKEGILAGACLGVVTMDEKHHHIYSICLLPEFQGKQLGNHLLSHYLRQTAVLSYDLSVTYSNKKATNLYQKIGFRASSTSSIVFKIT